MPCKFWTLLGVQAVVGQALSSATRRRSPSRSASAARITFGMMTAFHACDDLQPALQPFGGRSAGFKACTTSGRQPRAFILCSHLSACALELTEPLVKIRQVTDIGVSAPGISYMARSSCGLLIDMLAWSRHELLTGFLGIASRTRRAASVKCCNAGLAETRQGLVDGGGGPGTTGAGVGSGGGVGGPAVTTGGGR